MITNKFASIKIPEIFDYDLDLKCIKSAVVTSSAYCLQDVNGKILQLIESEDKIQYDKESNKSVVFEFIIICARAKY